MSAFAILFLRRATWVGPVKSTALFLKREGNILMLEFFRTITSRRNEDGASAVEYGLLVAGIAALIVAIVFVFGGVIADAFQGTCDQVKSGPTAGSATC
jgi:pilus assembly protein Flp/PilA